MDIEPACARHARDNVTIMIGPGDQGDKDFVKYVVQTIEKDGPLDIVIDDGSHRPEHQVMSFQAFNGLLQPHGVFIGEDLELNFDKASGRAKEGSFVEKLKTLSESIANIKAVRDETVCAIGAIHFAASMIVVQREPCREYIEIAAGAHISRIQERYVYSE